jgi:hypothetical protein
VNESHQINNIISILKKRRKKKRIKYIEMNQQQHIPSILDNGYFQIQGLSPSTSALSKFTSNGFIDSRKVVEKPPNFSM